MSFKLFSGLLAAALVLAPAAQAAPNDKLDGTWALTGWSNDDPKDQPFAGTFTLVSHGKYYDASWKAPGDVGHGVGYVKLIKGGTRVLALAYQGEKGPAVALYEISADNQSMLGDWVEDGFGHERLVRQAASKP